LSRLLCRRPPCISLKKGMCVRGVWYEPPSIIVIAMLFCTIVWYVASALVVSALAVWSVMWILTRQLDGRAAELLKKMFSVHEEVADQAKALVHEGHEVEAEERRVVEREKQEPLMPFQVMQDVASFYAKYDCDRGGGVDATACKYELATAADLILPTDLLQKTFQEEAEDRA
jgi:hypothetical protein